MKPRSAVVILMLAASGAFAQDTTKGRCDGYVPDGPPTLARLVAANCLPAPTGVNLGITVGSSARLDLPELLVLAYREAEQRGPQTLRLLRFDKHERSWTQTDLAMEPLRFPWDDGEMMPCQGSVGGLRAAGAFVLADIELSPSAGCTVVFDQQWKVRKVLNGWPVATLPSGAVVLEESTVHFAPTHPMRISLYEPERDTLTPLYPPKLDALRAEHQRRLEAIPAKQKCADPEHLRCAEDVEAFSSSLTHLDQRERPVVVNEATNALAFAVRYEAAGFVASVEPVPAFESDGIYVYRLAPPPAALRELKRSDLIRFGAASLKDLVTARALRQLFDAP